MNNFIVTDTDCWEWQGALNEKGYPLVTIQGCTKKVHRIYYERHYGKKIPDGLELDHLCRNRRCVNPLHLEAVTHAENVRRGAIAKLTQKDVDEIREMIYNGIRLTKISKQFNVSLSTISRIKSNQRWNKA